MTVTAPDKPETFAGHLPAVLAATVGAVLAALLGSYLGVAGTITGMAVGSLASGTCSWWAERGIRRSAAAAKARAQAAQRAGRPLHPAETEVIDRDATARHGQRPRGHRRWVPAAGITLAAFAACALSVTAIESAAGKPLSAVVHGQPGHGTTFGGGSGGGQPSAPVTPGTHSASTGTRTPTAGVTTAGTTPAVTPPATATSGPGTWPAATATARPSAGPSTAPAQTITPATAQPGGAPL